MRIFDDTILRNDGFHLPELRHDVAEGVLALDLRAVGVLGEDGGDVRLTRAEFLHLLLLWSLRELSGSDLLLDGWQLRDQQVGFDVHQLDPVADVHREADEIVKDLRKRREGGEEEGVKREGQG